MKLVDYGLELLSLDNRLYSGHRGSQHHHQLPSVASSTSSVPASDADDKFSDSPTPGRRLYAHGRAARHLAADSWTSSCLSCWLRQRVIAALLIVGLTVGITIVIASLVVYRRRLSLADSLDSQTNITFSEQEGASQIFEGRLRIIGGKFGNFRQEYNDEDSSEYRLFESVFRQSIDDVYKHAAIGNIYNQCRLVRISRGSVVATFYLYFNEKVYVDTTPLASDDVIYTTKDVESTLLNAIVQWTNDQTSGRPASHFIVDRKSLHITPVEVPLELIPRSNDEEPSDKAHPATAVDKTLNNIAATKPIVDQVKAPNSRVTANPVATVTIADKARVVPIGLQTVDVDGERIQTDPETINQKILDVVPSTFKNKDVGVASPAASLTTDSTSSSLIDLSSSKRSEEITTTSVTTTTSESSTMSRSVSLAGTLITLRPPSKNIAKVRPTSTSSVVDSTGSQRSNDLSLVEYSTSTSTSAFSFHSTPSKFSKTTADPSPSTEKASAEKDDEASVVVSCSLDEFACRRSGHQEIIEVCVPRRYLCDGKADCPDGVDEKTCSNRSDSADRTKACPTGYFRCSSGLGIGHRRCLRESSRCDRVRDCLDASDEMNCTYRCTEPGQFQCDSGALSRWPFSGYCLRPDERCNGIRECRDGSDETGCDVVPTTSPSTSSLSSTSPMQGDVTTTSTVSRCGADEWSCADAAACLPLAFRCDRRRHCADGSDEKNCDFRCPSGSFPCRSGTLDPAHGAGFCVAARAACDGIAHCADGSDEEDCNSTCADGYFRCRAGAHVINRQPCVPIEYVCDREQDCADGSDEPPSCNVTCPEQQVACLTGLVARWPFAGYCIERAELCDGMADCQDGSDEINCTSGADNSTSPISAIMMSAWCDIDQWTCRTTNETWCINITQLCNQQADCPDGSDELNCTYACALDQFRCVASAAAAAAVTSQPMNASFPDNSLSRCFAMTARCDGNVDCADASDETDCGSELSRPASPLQTVPTLLSCPPFYFRCKNGTRAGLRPALSASRMCVPDRYRCDRRRDCTDSSDESNCTYSCPAGHVACTSGALSRWPWRGYCIPVARRCDKRRDCADDSDETGCASGSDLASAPRCAASQFRCRNGTASVFGGGASRVCISARLRCDGVRDCSDGSDEISCDLTSFCLPTQFTCRSPGVAPIDRFMVRSRSRHLIYCLDASMRCDGIVQCPDASDETGCDVTYAADTCNGDFRCLSDFRCIPRRWTCDRELDCADGSDEANCTYACPDGEFRCQTGLVSRSPHYGFCVPSSRHCDGSVDCQDGSDETGCVTEKAEASNVAPSQCQSPTDLRCPTATVSGSSQNGCVPAERRCDRVADCADALDEIDCGYQCSDERRACLTGVVSGWPHRGFCIDISGWCDGVRHCVDGSDEAECARSTGCESGYFRCFNGTSPTSGNSCIASHAVCDGKKDCTDGSDETRCSRHLE